MKEITLNNVEQEFNFLETYNSCIVDLNKTIDRPPIALGIGYHDFKGQTYLNSTFTYGEMSAIIAPQKLIRLWGSYTINSASPTRILPTI